MPLTPRRPSQYTPLAQSELKVKTSAIVRDAKYDFSLSQADWGYKLAEREGLKVVHEKGKLDDAL